MRHPLSAWLAAPVLATVPFAFAHAGTCSFGASADGTSLQTVFDEMFGAANAPSTTTQCADPNDSLWHTVGSVGSSTILLELAGNASGNTLGIYDSTSPGTVLEIFAGSASASSSAFITVTPGSGGSYMVSVNGAAPVSFGSSAFGFYLQQPASAGGSRFYSESFRNGAINGVAANGSDYMHSYLGNNALFLNGSVYAPNNVEGTQFDSNDAIIAWEDLSQGSDRDYQDMVVLLRDIVPVPVPAAFWLLGSGLMMLPTFRRRRPAAT